MSVRSLNELLQEDSNAVDYFSDLPKEVKEHISGQPHNVHSFQDLKNIAESYTRR